MGSMFLAIGELNYATHCLLRALDMDSAAADAYYYLGVVSAAQGMSEDAARFFGHCLDINSEHVGALNDSALVYLTMGRPDRAAERIEKARNLAGDDPRVRAISRAVRRVRFRRRIGDSVRRLRPPFIRSVTFHISNLLSRIRRRG
jgi:tetratricopeptide (TPR) repeat protein